MQYKLKTLVAALGMACMALGTLQAQAQDKLKIGVIQRIKA